MNSPPVAGTFRLDGMLQGPTPGEERVADQMRDGVDRTAADGLTFHLAFEGGNYSMVADPTVQRWSRDDLSPGESLRKALDQFLELLAPDERSRAFSTIRCEEFLPGRALQSVFQISRDGKIENVFSMIFLAPRITIWEPVKCGWTASMRRRSYGWPSRPGCPAAWHGSFSTPEPRGKRLPTPRWQTGSEAIAS